MVAPVTASGTFSRYFEQTAANPVFIRRLALGTKVRFWHFSEKPTAPKFVAFWTNNGQTSAPKLNNYVAIDP